MAMIITMTIMVMDMTIMMTTMVMDMTIMEKDMGMMIIKATDIMTIKDMVIKAIKSVNVIVMTTKVTIDSRREENS